MEPGDKKPVSRLAFPLLLVFCALLPAAAPIAPASMPRPTPGRVIDAASANRDCEACHEEISREWRGSKHQRAYVDAAFQVALAREPLPFCRGCHAPEAPSSSPPEEDRAELGVACVTCHVVDGPTLAAPSPDESRPPHPVLRDPRFATAEACAHCHQFEFPDHENRREPEFMQLTVDEHKASSFSGVPCAGCHMPVVEGRRSHSFASSRDPQSLKRALHIDAARTSPTTARLTLRADRVGHAFPTGDLFRRLAVRAEVVGPDYAVLASDERFLSRHFEQIPGPLGTHARAVKTDDRPGAPALGGAPVIVDLSLGPLAEGRAIQYEIVYQRVAAVRDGHEEKANIESEVVLERGALPATLDITSSP